MAALGSIRFPWVVLLNVASVDGKLAGFDPEASIFYGVGARLDEHATLCSALSVYKPGVDVEEESDEDKAAVATTPGDERPVCVVVDSRGRVRNWHVLKKSGIWKSFVALISDSTPPEYLAYLEERSIKFIRTGADKVDLSAALQQLRETFDVRRVRVDGCGALNQALLSKNLVNEISLLVHPCIVGAGVSAPLFGASAGNSGEATVPTKLKLISALEAGETGYVWLRYVVEQA
jgi:2,5-diamino-6-(ribosylamino)-4(3H)-pyrimidinone 5'-phosphate reductase